MFAKNNAVEMLSEYLTISLNKIQVDYVFKNISASDVTIHVGFPLPPVNVFNLSGIHSWKEPHDQSFEVRVDGKKVIPSVDVRVTTMMWVDRRWIAKDITDEFKKLGLNPFDNEIGGSDITLKLRNLGAICKDEDGDDSACWSAQKTYHWEQTFPVAKEVKVTHSYAPWIGGYGQVSAAIEAPGICADDEFKKAYENLESKNELDEAYVDYILRTGANWAGPIGKFTLRIDKGRSILVSFCPIRGMRMGRSGNSFVGTAMNFVPKADLFIYFVGRGISPRPSR